MAAKTTKKAPAKSLPVVQEACASDGCYAPPLERGSYCAEHMLEEMAARITPSAKEIVFVKNGKIDRAALKADRALLESQVRHAKATGVTELAALPVPKAKETKAKPSQRTALNQPEASRVVATLLSRGWTPRTIGQGLGGLNSGYAKDWGLGKGCGRIAELKALLQLDPPAADAKASKGPKEPVTGSLKAPAEPKAAKARALPFEDPRQLRLALALRDALNAVLEASLK